MAASVVESFGDTIEETNSFTFAAPPTDDSQLLVMVFAGDEDYLEPATVIVGGDPDRPVYVTQIGVAPGWASFRFYQLEAGDETVVFTVSNPHKTVAFGGFQIAGAESIPTGWDDQIDFVDYAPTDTIEVDTTLLYDGLMVAAGVIAPPPAAMTAPAGWTLLAEREELDRQVQIIYQAAMSAGAVADAWTAGTVPTGGAASVISEAVFDLGLRIRPADVNVTPTNVAAPRNGAAGLPRQFPEPDPLPNLPPDPTPIVVPTTPWDTTRSPHRRPG